MRYILFDSDGVCIQAERFSDVLLREKGITTETTSAFFSTIFQECLIGKRDLKQSLPPYLEEWGIKSSVDELLAYWFSSENKPNTELLNYVQVLRKDGMQCYLATNQEKYRTEYMEHEMGFGNLFDSIFSSANLGFVKPARKFYEIIHTEIGSPNKKEVLFVDNTLENIQSADEFGFQTILYKNFPQCLESLKLLNYPH